MNRVEREFNKRRVGLPVIECYILDLVNGGGFGASLNALSIADIERNLPDGYELDIIITLENYFEPKRVDKYQIELKNSQYIYFEKFEKLVDIGFYEYLDALEREDVVKMQELDRKERK